MTTPPPIPTPFAPSSLLPKPAKGVTRCSTVDEALKALVRGAILVVQNYHKHRWIPELAVRVESVFIQDDSLVIASGRGGIYESTLTIAHIGKTIFLDIKSDD